MICCTQCSKQSSKLGSVGENVNDSEESSDDEMSYMSSKQSFMKSQQRPKSPSTKFFIFISIIIIIIIIIIIMLCDSILITCRTTQLQMGGPEKPYCCNCSRENEMVFTKMLPQFS